jgi:hemerythrin-like domain-containing protein
MAAGNRRYGRRDVIRGAGIAAGTVLALGRKAGAEAAREEKEEEAKVTPAEDLMREHAVLSRLLLVYETALPAGAGSGPPRMKEIGAAARLIRTFIEEYHEKLEEDYLFPRLEKAGKLANLVKTLRQQHEAGRRLTGAILEVTGATGSPDTARLERNIRAFIRMYRPHAARESTILFPQIQSVVSAQEYDQMGETFEDIEHQRFGREGFEGVVANVAEIEKRLAIYDLAEFTPKLT